MKYVEIVLNAIERFHHRLSRAALRVVEAVWFKFSRVPLSLRLAIGFFPLAILAVWCAHLVSGGYVAQCEFDESFVRYLERAGHLEAGSRLALACIGAAVLSVLAMLAALLKRAFSFRVMQAAWAAFAVASSLSVLWLMQIGPILVSADHKAFSSGMRNELWTGILFWSFIVILWTLALLLALLQRSLRRAYCLNSEPITRDAGEKALDAMKTTVGDRRWKSSIYYALTAFFFILFGPYLAFMWGWEEPYGLPQGGGQQVFEQVKVKKIKKKRPKKLTVNPWSPYILERMDIDDVVTLKELEEETRDTYAAQNSVNKGGRGKGTGGWPSGMEGAAIRFIRLKYRGGDWDQDMGKGADYNLLVKFNEWTGMKIAKDTEFREIERLKFFPKKKSPPFVFMTGMRGISISDREARVLREYCLNEGGMLFIDNGGGHFDSAVKSMLRKVFPGKPLVDIPNDDPIYQRPYVFPDGAPPFWHHAGYRAKGVRDEGRWVVFYHPGDINDAWRDDHSGASAEVADQAYKLGINVMFYAFNQYYRRHYEQ